MILDVADGIRQAAKGELSVWPNPNDGPFQNASPTEMDATDSVDRVDGTDVAGKLVSSRMTPMEDGYLKTTLTFEQDHAPGIRMVNPTAGEKRCAHRVVIR